MFKAKNVVLTMLMLASTATTYCQGIKGTFAIKNVVTGMLLRPLEASNKNQTPLVAYSPTNWKCMTWDFKQVEGNVYNLRNLLTNKTFQPLGGKINDGVSLEQQPLDETDSLQQWEFIPSDKSSFLIRLKGTQLYLTPGDEDGTSNSKIILAAERPGRLQYWTIYQQHPTM